jgi:hypothetical protein
VTPRQAVAFIKKHGVVLAAGKGPVPRLAEAIAGGPITGSWWGHAKGKEIFRVFRSLDESPEVLVCRLISGKVTYVHRRLWPALARAASEFPSGQLAWTREEHTESGHHAIREVAFPKWVPPEVLRASERLELDEALEALGPWATRGSRRRA